MSADTDRQFMTEKELARRTGIASATWRKLRFRGDGPLFVKATPGRRGVVRYDWADVLAWLGDRKVRSTADADQRHDKLSPKKPVDTNAHEVRR